MHEFHSYTAAVQTTKKTICIFAYSFLYEKKFIKKKLNSRSFAHFNKCYIEFKVLRCSETI